MNANEPAKVQSIIAVLLLLLTDVELCFDCKLIDLHYHVTAN
jgi:hypothetical protein